MILQQPPCGSRGNSHFLSYLPRGPAVLIELSESVPIDDHRGATADAALLAGLLQTSLGALGEPGALLLRDPGGDCDH